MQSSFVAAVIPVISLLITSAFMYTHGSFSVIKALNGRNSPNHNLHSSSLLMLFRKPCFSKCLFLSFSHSLFYAKFYGISTDPTPVVKLWLVS